jgi:ankyrin repeat protein
MTRPHGMRALLLVAGVGLAAGCATADPPSSGGSSAGEPPPRSTTTIQPPATSEPPVTLTRRPTRPQSALDESLRAAAWADDVRRARRLVALGADVNAKDETMQSAYLIAASEGHLELLDLALDHRARIDDKDSWNGTALIRAAERGHALVVGRLLQAGIDRDHVNRIGYQAIHEAVWLGEDTSAYVDTVRVLAAGGAALTTRSGTERLTPLEMARERGYADLERTLEELTGTTRIGDPDEELLRAATSGDADRAALALRAGAHLEARDSRRRTALLLAATHDRVAVARLLVAMGADPTVADRDGMTALEQARANGYTRIASVLASP